MTADRETWTFTMQLPAGIRNGGRFVARLLKHLLRCWGVRCVALETDTEIRRLQGIIDGLARRVAAQSELLARRTEFSQDSR